jgi:hypothetical protein
VIQRKAAEWCNKEDGREDNSPMDTNHSGHVYLNDNVCLERLKDWKDTICLEEVQANW